jgi:hypothetical protein
VTVDGDGLDDFPRRYGIRDRPFFLTSMAAVDLDAWVARLQDIESHTIVYLRSLLATRAIDDPEVATFLACWVREEIFHGLALSRFLEAAGIRSGRDRRPADKSRCASGWRAWRRRGGHAGRGALWPITTGRPT